MADPTIIAAGTTIAGNIQGSDGDLTIEGFVDGSIELTATVQIAAQGRVNGDIRADQIVVEGVFQGEIHAQSRVILAATARAEATINAPLVEMAEGAQLRGELNVGVDDDKTGATTARPATSRTSTRTTSSRPSTTSASPRPRRAGAASLSPSPTTSPTSTSATSTATATNPTPAATTTVVEEPVDDEEPEPVNDQAAAEDEAELITEEEVEEYREDFTVKELRDRLRNLDLRVSGTKDELIERLLAAEAQES